MKTWLRVDEMTDLLALAANDVLISIASDGHGIGHLEFLGGGILQARRGWLSKDQVLNSCRMRELRSLLRKTFLA